MAQQLILPLNNTLLTASWKTEAYRKRFGFVHYGADMVSAKGNLLVYSCGAGEVLAAGYDAVLGNALVIRYPSALNRVTGEEEDVICRMFHLSRLMARKGDRLTKDTPLGFYGNTGQYGTGAHLHLEMDRDVLHPFHTPTISGRSAYFAGSRHGANDSTMSNPLEWLHCKESPPDYQSYTAAEDPYIRPEDREIAVIF